ncbi:sentrin-specific protease 7 isoform 2-T3 [Discoglossus pictus]
MMEKQRKDSPSSTNVKSSMFKIPKKKADDWSEDVQMNSPLSRIAETELKNVTTRKRPWASSYNSFNKPRNKDSNNYSMKKSSPPMCSRSEKNRRLLNETGSPKEKDDEAVVSVRNRTREQKEHPEDTSPSKACRDVSNSPVSPQKEIGRGSNRRCNVVQGRHDSKKETGNECKEPMKCSVISPMNKSTHEKTYCHRRVEQQQNKAALLSSNAPPPDDPKIIHIPSVEQNLVQSTNASNIKTVSTVKVNDGVKVIKEKMIDGDLLANKKHHHPTVQIRVVTRRNLHRSHSSREMPSSAEPIVLSSDEEERECTENPAAVCGQAINETVATVEEKENSVDLHQTPDGNKITEPANHDDCSDSKIELNDKEECPVLEFKFANIYYGRKKGRATGTAKFTTKSVDIPLKVALQKSISLSLDTTKLQKYGLWILDGDDSVKSNCFIFLWLAADHVQHIAKQMGTNQTSMANDFIFLELCDTPTKIEEEMLNRIMKEVSRNSLPVLGDSMSLEKVYPMLKNLSHDESSFMANCFASFQAPQNQQPTAQALPEPLPQDSKKEPNPPAYTVMQRYKDGVYTVSLIPKRDGWTEMQSSGSLLKLIVYPPPPTKGGLGVTNEDLQCLEHGEFLNDVIIDFYLKYLWLEKFPKDFAERSHIFSSFFFKCLTRKDNGYDDSNTSISAAERRHQGVKTWTRHVDIFTKDFIFVPVNEKSHWYLVVICFPWLEEAIYEGKEEQNSSQGQHKKTKQTSNKDSVIVFNERLAKEEETMEEDSKGQSEDTSNSSVTGSASNEKCKEIERSQKVCKRPCLLIFDSLKIGSVQSTVQILREYLKVEWHVKRKSAREFSRSYMRDFYPKVPKQNNSTDCGLYLLQYVESFVQRPIESFNPPMQLENWFCNHVVKSKREEIRDLILQLHLKQKSGNR